MTILTYLRKRRSTLLGVIVLLFFLNILLALQKKSLDRRDCVLEKVDRLRAALGVSERVVVTTVPENERLASVEPLGEDTFLLSLDQSFFQSLSCEQLEGVIAHELGHVWIFTHHPYLHTEVLANEIALKAVSRETLEGVYERAPLHHVPLPARVTVLQSVE